MNRATITIPTSPAWTLFAELSCPKRGIDIGLLNDRKRNRQRARVELSDKRFRLLTLTPVITPLSVIWPALPGRK